MAVTNITTEKLEALRKREATLRLAISKAVDAQRRRDQKSEARLASTIGAALLQYAGKHRDFELMLKSVLQSITSYSASEVKLLRAKGWL